MHITTHFVVLTERWNPRHGNQDGYWCDSAKSPTFTHLDAANLYITRAMQKEPFDNLSKVKFRIRKITEAVEDLETVNGWHASSFILKHT